MKHRAVVEQLEDRIRQLSESIAESEKRAIAHDERAAKERANIALSRSDIDNYHAAIAALTSSDTVDDLSPGLSYPIRLTA